MKYECKSCGASNCKLWRQYMTSYVELKCAECAASIDPDIKIDTLDAAGTVESLFGLQGRRTDQLGWWVPAVPVDDTIEAFWAYTAVPDDAIAKWRLLPSLPVRV